MSSDSNLVYNVNKLLGRVSSLEKQTKNLRRKNRRLQNRINQLESNQRTNRTIITKQSIQTGPIQKQESTEELKKQIQQIEQQIEQQIAENDVKNLKKVGIDIIMKINQQKDLVLSKIKQYENGIVSKLTKNSSETFMKDLEKVY